MNPAKYTNNSRKSPIKGRKRKSPCKTPPSVAKLLKEAGLSYSSSSSSSSNASKHACKCDQACNCPQNVSEHTPNTS